MEVGLVEAQAGAGGAYGADAGRSGASRSHRRAELAMFLIVLIACAYFVPRGPSWNADTHVFLTASIVDRGTLDIDPLARYTGDVAYARGHYYADKAPGLSLLAVPVYAALKMALLQGQPYTSVMTADGATGAAFLIRYLLSVVYAAVPTALIALLLYRLCQRRGLAPRWAALVGLTYGLGTLARPFGGQFFSHQLAALLLFAAYYLLHGAGSRAGGPKIALAVGALLGMAVITEYPTALIALVLLLYALAGPLRGRGAAALVVAGMIPLLLLGAAYNLAAFGSVVSVGYQHLAGPEVFRAGQSQGLLGVTYPQLDAVWQTTFGPYRGMLFWSPVLLLALPGAVRLLRCGGWRRDIWCVVGIVGLYGLFSVSYFAWDGGYSPGPRQFLPALPFAMPLVAEFFRTARRTVAALGVALSAISIVSWTLVSAAGALFDPRYSVPLTQVVLPRLAGFDVREPGASPGLAQVLSALVHEAPFLTHAQLDNNWGMLVGLPGALQLVPLVVVTAALAIPCWHRRRLHATVPSGSLDVSGPDVSPARTVASR